MAINSSTEIHLIEYWQIFQRRKLLAMITGLAVIGITYLVTWMTHPVYEAGAKILITRQQPRIMVFPDSSGYSQYQQNYLATQIEIIKSLPVIRVALKKIAPQITDKELDDRAHRLLPMIRVSMVGRTDMVYLAVEGQNSNDVVALANSLSTSFQDEMKRSTAQSAEEVYAQLTKELLEYKQKVDDAEGILAAFLAEKDMVKVGGYTDTDFEKLSEYNKVYLTTVMRTTELQLILEQLRRVAKDPNYGSSVKILADNPLIQQLYTQMVEQDMDLKKLEREYKEGYPQIVELKADMDLTRSKIDEEIQRVLSSVETELKAEKAKEESLKGMVEQYKNKAVELGENEQEYLKLQKEAKKYQDVYELLKKKLEEIQIVDELSEDRVQIVEPATRAVQIKPNVKANAACGLATAVVLSIFMAFLSEYMDKSVRTFAQIRDKLGLQVLGVVPNMSLTGSSGSGNASPRIIPADGSRSPAAEAYRSLRTHLQFLQGRSTGQTLLITSPLAGEGKSTTVANLGTVMAQGGLRVLLVDSDLRRPTLHKCFKILNTVGVSSVLSGRENVSDVIRQTGLETLSVLSSGPLPQNPAELIGSKEMQDLVATLRERYDFVLFDSPPTIAVTDASVLAQIVDGTLLVVRGGGTSVDAARRATEVLEQVGAKIFGVVLNHVMPKEGAYYYYYYYRYYDSYYGPSKSRSDSSETRGHKRG